LRTQVQVRLVAAESSMVVVRLETAAAVVLTLQTDSLDIKEPKLLALKEAASAAHGMLVGVDVTTSCTAAAEKLLVRVSSSECDDFETIVSGCSQTC
jgi:hypothetical protein